MCCEIPTSCSRVSLKRQRFTGSITDNVANMLPARKIVKVMSVLPDRLLKTDTFNQQSPQCVLESIFTSRGMNSTTYSYDQLEGFFVAARDEEIKAWDFDVLRAIRDGDVEKLRDFHESGRPLKCSNKFGESLLHLACRKGLVAVVDFLINEVGVPVQVVDDMGRTALHDAFWTPEPNPEVVDLIVEKCADLLFVKDKRGHIPLNYARQAHWGKWSEYLMSRSEIISQGSLLNGKKQ
jgi:Ankyrin repeats (3 copies)